MRFPLNKEIQKWYKFGDWTFYNKKHRGTDYKALIGHKLYAPTDGYITTFSDHGGGNWINFKDDRGYIWQFAHLDRYVKFGQVKEGEHIAYTGNTGAWTTGAHLHIQIKNRLKIFIDPEIYIKQRKERYMEELKRLETKIDRVSKDRHKEVLDLWKAMKDRMDTETNLLKAIEKNKCKCTGKTVKALKTPENEPQSLFTVIREFLQSYKK